MYLGIEIGGTKLQLGVGNGTGGAMAALERRDVRLSEGAEGIRRQIVEAARPLLAQFDIQTIVIGFGGPVDHLNGRIIKSYHVRGWDGFALRQWCEDTLQRPTVVENDTNAGGLAEALYGAGMGTDVVLYSNVGTGIGAALILNGNIYHGGSGITVAEIGHLRPGPACDTPDQHVESFSSGWGIAANVQMKLQHMNTTQQDYRDLSARCGGDLSNLSTKIVLESAARGNRVAQDVVQNAIRTYGWALGTAITLLSPGIVVIGGGVAQAGEAQFLQPLRDAVSQYVMPILEGSYRIVPAQLGEEVVVHGALALAKQL